MSKQIDKLKSEYLPKLQQYEYQEKQLNGRSSYSKTDPEATFMRTKDDHLGNGQLKPCYNIQIGTEDQFVINFTTHQTSSDMVVFTNHMDDTLSLLNKIEAPVPKRVCADAGYGSEENYAYLEDKDMEAYVKYPGYYIEQTKGRKADLFHSSNLYYNKEQDYFVCPMGQHMTLKRTVEEKTSTGYIHTVHEYQAQRCEGCPLRGMCHEAKTERTLRINHRSAAFRQQAKKKLDSLRGIRMRSQRGVDTEPVFGHIKQDRGFRRFMLKGCDGVNTEIGLLFMAHNLKKWWVKQCQHGSIVPLKPADTAKNTLQDIKSSQISLDFEKIRA